MLVLTRKPNQSIRIDNHITVSIVRVRGNTIQLGIDAPREVHIVRSELLEKEDRGEATSAESESEGGSAVDGEAAVSAPPELPEGQKLLDFSLVF